MKSPREDRDVVQKARDFSLEGEGFLDGTGQNHRRPQGGRGGGARSSVNHSDREEARQSTKSDRKVWRRKKGWPFFNEREGGVESKTSLETKDFKQSKEIEREVNQKPRY